MIVVNATALDKSGALSILRQFIENIPADNRKWLIFVSPIVEVKSTNPYVEIVRVENVKSLPRRLWWDAFGLKKWLKKNNIVPLAALSLQNTGFSVGRKVPTFIYYHQPVPFFNFKWNPLKKNERTFWFYKHIYPLLVNLFLKKDTKIFVQLDFIKEGFAKRFKHPKNLIKIYSPSVTAPDSEEIATQKNADTSKTTILFPAMPHFYKNHRIIDEAMKKTGSDVEVIFTIKPGSIPISDHRIKLIGMQPYDYVCRLYKTCDALIFPSYIETFGLPLLEAALTGMPIIAADLPYAREVLEGYDGVTFVAYNDPDAWAAEISKVKKNQRFSPIDISNRPGWSELFNDIQPS